MNRQLPDGTMIRTAPGGQTYTTQPGSRLLFPTLCTPTAPVVAPADAPSAWPNRGLMMPRRTTTRERDRATRIDAERARSREIREQLDNTRDGQNPENSWGDTYFPTRPPPDDDEDSPPF